MSIATAISEKFDNDGQNFTTGSGVDFVVVCREFAPVEETRNDSGFYHFVFNDYSAIIVDGDCWDIGFPECNCMETSGHKYDCANA